MSFTDALDKAKSEFKKGPRCAISLVLAGHAEADQIRAAINDHTIPGTLVARALNESGSKVSDGAVQRHRRGVCDCDQP